MFSQIHKHKPHLILDNGINVYTHTHIYKERNGSDLVPSKCCLHVFFNGILRVIIKKESKQMVKKY